MSAEPVRDKYGRFCKSSAQDVRPQIHDVSHVQHDVAYENILSSHGNVTDMLEQLNIKCPVFAQKFE